MNIFGKPAAWMKAHKFYAAIVILAIIGIGYWSYSSATKASAAPTYTLATARMGSITQTVTGTGQVAAENQLDVTSQVSGAVKSIAVSVGDHVVTGQLLATIDSHDALISLQNAQIAYDKLVAPAKSGDLANTQNSVAKAYSDGFNSTASSFIDLSTVMSGMKDMLYGKGGFLSDAYSVNLNTTARTMRDATGLKYDAAAGRYTTVLLEYQKLNQNSPRADIDALIADTYSLLKSVSESLAGAQSTVNFVIANQPDYYSHDSPTAVSNLNSWSSSINSDLASALSSQNSIATNNNSLSVLLTGADTLDVQSQQLSLQQAQDTYAKYFIRAPFDGIIGRIPVSVYSQASGSTVIATVIGDQKISTISLNEVDAAKVAAGQMVTLTFDAIDGFTATGTVKSIDLVGSVSSGVVSYGVKIVINTSDSRIKPGMSINATIITLQKDGVLVVPSSAVKTQGSASYVQTFDPTFLKSLASATAAPTTNPNASSSERIRFARSGSNALASSTFASSTGFGSTTRRATGSSNFGSQTSTITTATTPAHTTVVIGDSDGTYTEIVSGLTRGTSVVTKTSSTGTASTAAPSILQSLSGNRTGAVSGARTGGAVRIGG